MQALQHIELRCLSSNATILFLDPLLERTKRSDNCFGIGPRLFDDLLALTLLGAALGQKPLNFRQVLFQNVLASSLSERIDSVSAVCLT